MIIRAHSVRTLPSGLSPMQERLLRSEKPVRLVSAPTGTGKSYAFMRAVFDEGAHVLFIVPTKRLLQNLIDDARDQARQRLRDQGMTGPQIEAWTNERIVEWSGNQAPDGSESLAAARVRQILAAGTGADGRIIFAIPEVVVRLISGIRITGASTVNPFLYVRTFDHIVFDEFHTIDDRSFGLACLISLLAVTERRGRVSLLSATPIDVRPILARIGASLDDLELIVEEVSDGHAPGNRPIHGNVAVTLRESPIRELIGRNIQAIRASIAAGYTVIVIYDSLKRLKQDLPLVQGSLHAAGVPEHRVLSVNSIDDSERKPGEPPRGRRYVDPRGYNVLVCTSSVENGVSFRSSLMFTEPSYSLAGFVQRVGRVARGAVDGQVIVSLPDCDRRRTRWKQRMASVIEAHREVDVCTFVGDLLRDVRSALEPTRKETETAVGQPEQDVPFYRRASWRGMFWAALFIVAIRRLRMTVQRGADTRLRQIVPGVVRFVDAKIGEMLSVERVNDYLPAGHAQPHKQWVRALLVAALTYRDIGASVCVVDPDGTRHTVTESFLRRATDIPVVCEEEDGQLVIRLTSRSLNDEIVEATGPREMPRLRLYIRSPIGRGDFSLSIPERERGTESLSRRLVEEWRHRFRDFIPEHGQQVSDPRMKVMGAATALVEKLGWSPHDEDFEDADRESALFA